MFQTFNADPVKTVPNIWPPESSLWVIAVRKRQTKQVQVSDVGLKYPLPTSLLAGSRRSPVH